MDSYDKAFSEDVTFNSSHTLIEKEYTMLKGNYTFIKQFSLLLVGMILMFSIILFLPYDLYLEITDEDKLIESLTAIFFLLGGITFLVLFYKNRTTSQTIRKGLVPQRIYFLLLGIFFIFCFGEEISWGQRILGYETPSALKEVNVQEEFNIHNLKAFNLWDKEHKRKTGIGSLFTIKRIFMLTFITYLLLIPLLHFYNNTIRGLLDRLNLPIPPIWLGVLFLSNILIYRLFKLAANGDHLLRSGLGEVEEFNAALLLMVLPFHWYLTNSQLTEQQTTTEQPRPPEQLKKERRLPS